MNCKTLRNIIPALLLVLAASSAWAQVPTYITAGGSSNNNFPFNTTSSNKVQWLYPPSDFTPSIPAGLITHVFFRSGNSGGQTKTFSDLRISIGYANFTTFPNGTFVTGLTQCYLASTTTINIPSNGWFGVELDNPFTYDGTSNLVIEATITNTTGITVAQATNNGNKRIWGNRTASSGSTGTGQAPCGLEIVTCSTAITQHPVTSVTVCEDQQTTFSAAAIDVDNYQWQVDEGTGYMDITNNTNYAGATTNKLTVKNIPANFDGFKYRCMALKSSCADSSNAATLRVNGLVKSDPLPVNDTTCIGSTKDLMIKSAGAVTGYKWQIFIQGQGYVDVPNAPPYVFMNDTLRINGVPDTLDGSKFRCVVDGVCNTSTSTATNLTVNIVPSVAVHPQDQLVNHGQSVSFEVQATGSGATYQWQVQSTNMSTFANINNNGIYSGVKTNRLRVTGASRIQNDYKFRCIIGTSSGCITPGEASNFAVLNVNPPLSVSTIADNDLMLLYPNPTGTSELYIRLSGKLAGDNMKYKVVDKTGRTILVGNISNAENTLVNVGSLPADIYLVQVLDSGNNTVANSRFTKL